MSIPLQLVAAPSSWLWAFLWLFVIIILGHHYCCYSGTQVATYLRCGWLGLDSGAPEAPRGPCPSRSGASCCPGDGSAVLLGLHAQSGDAGGLAVRVHVEVVSIDARAHPLGPPEQAAHVCLSHVAPRAGHAQEVRHTAAGVGVRGHAGGDSVTGHHTARDGGGSVTSTNPRWVLDLKGGGKVKERGRDRERE